MFSVMFKVCCLLFCVVAAVGHFVIVPLSKVWHLLLPLMNSFNKTQAAVFPMQTMLLENFPFLLRLKLETAIFFFELLLIIFILAAQLLPFLLCLLNQQQKTDKYIYLRLNCCLLFYSIPVIIFLFKMLSVIIFNNYNHPEYNLLYCLCFRAF